LNREKHRLYFKAKYQLWEGDYVKEVALVAMEVLDGIETGRKLVYFQRYYRGKRWKSVEMEQPDTLDEVIPKIGDPNSMLVVEGKRHNRPTAR
jgi:hypothetical protein